MLRFLRAVPGAVVIVIGLTDIGGAQGRLSEFWSRLTPDQQRLAAIVVGTALILVPLLWERLPGNRETIRGRRFEDAFESLITRSYRDSSGDIAEEGRRHEDAPDFERRQRYQQVGVIDLYEPRAEQGSALLDAKAREGDGYLEELSRTGESPSLMERVRRWERQSNEDYRSYAFGWRDRLWDTTMANLTVAGQTDPTAIAKSIKTRVDYLRGRSRSLAKRFARQAARRASVPRR
jgi:hypothetical protein